jgi:hypothetical protein
MARGRNPGRLKFHRSDESSLFLLLASVVFVPFCCSVLNKPNTHKSRGCEQWGESRIRHVLWNFFFSDPVSTTTRSVRTSAATGPEELAFARRFSILGDRYRFQSISGLNVCENSSQDISDHIVVPFVELAVCQEREIFRDVWFFKKNEQRNRFAECWDGSGQDQLGGGANK